MWDFLLAKGSALHHQSFAISEPILLGSCEPLTHATPVVIDLHKIVDQMDRDRLFRHILPYVLTAFRETTASASAESIEEHYEHTFHGDMLILMVATTTSNTNHEIIGHALLTLKNVLSRQILYLNGIVVNPSATKRAIATKLLLALVSQFASSGCILTCWTQSIALTKSLERIAESHLGILYPLTAPTDEIRRVAAELASPEAFDCRTFVTQGKYPSHRIAAFGGFEGNHDWLDCNMVRSEGDAVMLLLYIP